VLKKSMESELTRRLHSIAFRATKAECLDLPMTLDIVRTATPYHLGGSAYPD